MNTWVQPGTFPIGIVVLLATSVLADAVALGSAVATVKVGGADFALVAAVAFATLEEGFNTGRLVDDGRGFAADIGRGFAADDDWDDLAGVAFAIGRGAAFGCFSFGRGVGFTACEGSGLFTSVACSAVAY